MFAQQVANGLFAGAVYALFAIGYTLVFGVLDILNLAHAAIYMAGAVIAVSLIVAGWPIVAAVGIAVVAAGCIGVALDRVAFAPLRRRNAGTLAPLISSIAVAIIIESLARGTFGINEQPFPVAAWAGAPIHAAGITFTVLDAATLGTAIGLMLALGYVLRATALGRSIRAVAEDRIATVLLGIDVERTIAATFFIASALGGAAGILVGMEYNSVSIDMGSRIELKGLAVIILGGMGSVTGAVIGGFVLGAVETFSVAYVSSSLRDALAFGVMFLILVARPTGILGRKALRVA